jgi:hypothetical protein
MALNTGLLPRPWSCHRPKVDGYAPLISGDVERVSRRKHAGWRVSVFVDEARMYVSHHDTKERAERQCEEMLDIYTKVHYVNT